MHGHAISTVIVKPVWLLIKRGKTRRPVGRTWHKTKALRDRLQIRAQSSATAIWRRTHIYDQQQFRTQKQPTGFEWRNNFLIGSTMMTVPKTNVNDIFLIKKSWKPSQTPKKELDGRTRKLGRNFGSL